MVSDDAGHKIGSTQPASSRRESEFASYENDLRCREDSGYRSALFTQTEDRRDGAYRNVSLQSPVRRPPAFYSGLALASLVAISCPGKIDLKPWFLDLPIAVPTYVVAAGAFVAGLLIYRGVAPRGGDDERSVGAVGVLILCAAILAAVAVRSEALPAAVGVLVLLLGGAAVLAADRAFRLIEQGASLEFESHWGGLGGIQTPFVSHTCQPTDRQGRSASCPYPRVPPLCTRRKGRNRDRRNGLRLLDLPKPKHGL